MIGTLLALFATFIQEMSSSQGKRMLEGREITFSVFGIATYFFSALIFFVIAINSGVPVLLSAAGLFTFGIRLFFEVIQSELQFRALELADRTTFGFLRVLTIPLLLVVDVVLGYDIATMQFIGVILITIALFFMFSGSQLKSKGAVFALLSAVNAVITISLYKYNITNFHSVAIEQFYITFSLLLYFTLRLFIFRGDATLKMVINKKVLSQSFATGFGTTFASYAYQFGPASLILAVLRSGAVFWSFVSGALYFKETHLQKKLILSTILVIAIFFIVR